VGQVDFFSAAQQAAISHLIPDQKLSGFAIAASIHVRLPEQYKYFCRKVDLTTDIHE
jgi:hypothetical protein